MKKFLIVCFLAIGFSSFSQVYFRNLVYNRKSFYFEGMGNGMWYSLNYEWLFKDYGIKQGIRGGPCVFKNFFSPNKPLVITANLEYVGFWLHRYHHIEWGAGLTYRYEKYSTTALTYTYVIVPPDTAVTTISHTIDYKTTGPLIVGRLGYRYQSPDGGLMIRAGWTPMFSVFNKTKQYYDGSLINTSAATLANRFLRFGVSIGYNFY